MHTFIMQDWITARGAGAGNTVIQSESEWLDLTGYEDIVIWIDVREVTGAPNLTFQTSPTKDEAFFGVNGGNGIFQFAVVAGTAAPHPVLLSAAIPIARYLRWTLSGAANPFDATFRVMIAANAVGS